MKILVNNNLIEVKNLSLNKHKTNVGFITLENDEPYSNELNFKENDIINVVQMDGTKLYFKFKLIQFWNIQKQNRLVFFGEVSNNDL